MFLCALCFLFSALFWYIFIKFILCIITAVSNYNQNEIYNIVFMSNKQYIWWPIPITSLFSFSIVSFWKFENARTLDLLKIDHIIRDLSRDADVDHPIHEVEGEEHDGEDDSAVLVDITGSHAKYPCWWSSWSRRKNRSDGMRREEGGVTSSSSVPISLVISG